MTISTGIGLGKQNVPEGIAAIQPALTPRALIRGGALVIENAPQGRLSVAVHTLSGQLLAAMHVDNTARDMVAPFHKSSAYSGMYVVRISTAAGVTELKPIMNLMRK
jgi:hypothetical protein